MRLISTDCYRSARSVYERWAYDELLSSRFAHLYDGYAPTLPLRKKARDAVPVTDLDASERDHLTFMHYRVRGRFLQNVLKTPLYVEVLADKTDIERLAVLPAMADGPPPDFATWLALTPPEHLRPIRSVVEDLDPAARAAILDKPVVIELLRGRLTLVDGYLRATLFLERTGERADIPAFVPFTVASTLPPWE